RQVELNRRMNKRFGEAIGLLNLGYNYAQLGLLELGRQALEDSLEITAAVSARHLTLYAWLNLGLIGWRRGDYETTAKRLTGTIDELAALGDAFGRAAGLSYLGLVLEGCGDQIAAQRKFQEAHDAFGAAGQEAYAHDARAGLLRCSLEVNDLAGARVLADELWTYLAGGGARAMEFPALAFVSCARAFDQLGDSQLARDVVAAGYEDLTDRAGKIRDLDWRRSFLENVEEHRTLGLMVSQ
ncbi:MAG: hypothetical protein PVJ75_13105, partial [Chloroflexota bacterium]